MNLFFADARRGAPYVIGLVAALRLLYLLVEWANAKEYVGPAAVILTAFVCVSAVVGQLIRAGR